MEERKKIAILGTGIAGMACAYHLRRRHALTVYEKNNYIGGHTNTVTVSEDGKSVPIDTGFMVYNTRTYPNLVRFFDELGIRSKPTSMSFGINNTRTRFEARFTNLRTFFAQTFAGLNPGRWRMLAGIKAFFEDANAYLEGTSSREETLGDYVNRTNPNPGVIENLILPMASAIWSTSPDHMLKMPAHTLFTFLKNHGMLGIGTQFQWLTLVNGSQQYRDIVKREIEPCIKLSNGAVSVLRRPNGGATVIDERGERRDFDAVVIATHADQAYNLLERPTLLEAKALRKFKYNANTAVLHSDPSVMPKARRAWASWNYRYDDHAGRRSGSTHYWMNSLQGVSDKRDYFVSVDYGGDIDPSKIHWSTTYEHPRYDADAIRAQKDLPSLNFDGSIYYCGSYFRYGFHEDAYTSALHVCKMIAAKYGQGAAA